MSTDNINVAQLKDDIINKSGNSSIAEGTSFFGVVFFVLWVAHRRAGRGRARCGLVQWNVRGAKQNYIWPWVGAQIVGKADTRDPPRRGDGAGGER